MRADLPTGIAEASAQSLIKTTWFRALRMCNSPFWVLKRKRCYILLWNALIWGSFMCCPQRAWETRLWPEWQGCSSAALYNPQIGQLRKMPSLPFHDPDLWVHQVDWVYSKVEGRQKGWDGTVGSQCQPADVFTSLENLEVQRTWLRALPSTQRHLGLSSEWPTH